ncbi:hypothetical protein QBC33DRAFT_526301 [Phialemonium atrogriseum]|uniref:Secreted protein n=1 Tax=Phialemonium atrogriseum TaxID=1093897 RepID=A0AAJ0C975_9PEZI|nr:uncharacterized protein QBC33DRAFT_526301 [Phialemonium atrogriseum]KAK1770959.1 hypothetical protein QBC33DRAFT_526301 [Phialemonium atrogriseum]
MWLWAVVFSRGLVARTRAGVVTGRGPSLCLICRSSIAIFPELRGSLRRVDFGLVESEQRLSERATGVNENAGY